MIDLVTAENVELLNAELAAQCAELAAQRAELAAQCAELAAQCAELAAQRAELAAQRAKLVQRDDELAAQRAKLVQRNAEVYQLTNGFGIDVHKEMAKRKRDDANAQLGQECSLFMEEDGNHEENCPNQVGMN